MSVRPLSECQFKTSKWRVYVSNLTCFCFSCETVRSAVTAQFIRDLKGTIVSIFNEDSTLGKKYVFDIRRTCREVYDNARRAIYQESQARLALDAGKPDGSECDGEHCKVSCDGLVTVKGGFDVDVSFAGLRETEQGAGGFDL